MVIIMADLATTNGNVLSTGSDFQIPTGFICTFDISTVEGKIKLGQALNGAVTMRDKVGDVLRATNFVTTPGVRSRTGEACTNSYILCDDGTIYMTQSDGIAKSIPVNVGLCTMVTGNGNEKQFVNPVELGIGFRIEERETQNGNTIKLLVPVALA